MMNRALINFDTSTLDQIHLRSMELLQDCGIRFPSEKTLEVFKRRGFRIDGQTVYFEEKDIVTALETVPGQFTIKARDPEKKHLHRWWGLPDGAGLRPAFYHRRHR
jgi:trimethylamine:corrinoid methyltransferase-like protein